MISVDVLRRAWDSVGERTGWDFSRMRTERGPVPWVYEDVVRELLSGDEMVLDVGTGGGEKLASLAGSFGHAMGIDNDPEMVRVAQERLPDELRSKIAFRVGAAESTGVPDGSVDAVLNRNSVAVPREVARALRPGGLFITQQVGRRNMANVLGPFGGQDFSDDQLPEETRDGLVELGFEVRRFEEYDVPYYYLDVESLVFHVKALGVYLPVRMEFDVIADTLAEVVEATATGDGRYATNEQRYLIVAEKR